MRVSSKTKSDSSKNVQEDLFEIEEPPHPLTSSTKKTIFRKIKKFKSDTSALKKALKQAALRNCKFPSPINQKLDSMQLAYQINKDDEAVKPYLEQAIKVYINTVGYDQFLLLLSNSLQASDWCSGFLYALAENLKISWEEDPLVEMAIKKGKVYWRIIKGEKILYDRTAEKGQPFNFERAETCYMDWESFRLFKDSGKRQGTVAITRRRFTRKFSQAHQEQAATVWNELKEKGILNKNNRLSVGWESISNTPVILESLTKITSADIKACFKKLGIKNNSVLERKDFIEYWSLPYQYRAGLIWDYFKEKKILNSTNKLTTLQYAIDSFSKNLQFNYSEIAGVLYSIANNQEFQEQLDVLEKVYCIYREERSLKSWAKTTGNVRNDLPKDDEHCVQLWDVGIYNNLKLHSKKNDELDLDHIPSKKALKLKSKDCAASIEQSIEQLEDEDEIKNLTLDREQWDCEVKDRNGLQWWAVAIPRKFHVQGNSFGEGANHQAADNEHPFHEDVSAYLDILEIRKEEFKFPPEEPLKALGAFRYMYRCQIKEPEVVDNHYVTGLASQAFFKDSAKTKEIDCMFFEKIKQFIVKREGLEITHEKKHPLKVNPT